MSYLALYRKYRPQSFSDVVGQEHVVKTLQNALKSEKVAHAYLFCGPRGVGKTTIARLLAKAINCDSLGKSKDIEACDKCEFCSEINANKAVDIIEIDAASNRGIDEMRELKEKIKFTPNHLKYKVFIIDEVHMLTIEAFNALLKTLEEPPAHAIFILATTEAHKIPATILSRCQRFDFKKFTHKEIVNQLSDIAGREKVKIDNKSLSLLASNASGSSRDGLSLLNQVVSLEDKEITFDETKSILGIPDLSQVLDFVDNLIAKDVRGAIKLINDISDSGYDLKQFFKNLLEYFRKLLLAKVDKDLISNEGIDLDNEQLDKLKE
ncbi:MAG: DNA polymerase III subunit gamma/tau, partial [Parcubacteria group bacterium]|nr:DNA polymerase III subunit gamma/tau [Parcubacteria group bacterium]